MSTRFQSPLLGTALVALALGLLAIPLHRLTAKQDPVTGAGNSSGPPPAAAGDSMPCILRLRALAPLRDVELLDRNGKAIFHHKQLEAGETEWETPLAWHDGEIDLQLIAEAADQETAVFLTVMPDGYEERTAYAIGSGRIDEELHFEWNHP